MKTMPFQATGAAGTLPNEVATAARQSGTTASSPPTATAPSTAAATIGRLADHLGDAPPRAVTGADGPATAASSSTATSEALDGRFAAEFRDDR